jgi:Zn finger protein HypA/HybF involved in hydrogenase expression
LPDCHFKIEAALALGKLSLCQHCDEPFIMNEYTIKLKRPHCMNCGKKQITTADGRKVFVNKRSVQVLQLCCG